MEAEGLQTDVRQGVVGVAFLAVAVALGAGDGSIPRKEWTKKEEGLKGEPPRPPGRAEDEILVEPSYVSRSRHGHSSKRQWLRPIPLSILRGGGGQIRRGRRLGRWQDCGVFGGRLVGQRRGP